MTNSIWTYADVSNEKVNYFSNARCPYCSAKIESLGNFETSDAIDSSWINIEVCQFCGWWKCKSHKTAEPESTGNGCYEYYGADCGSILNFTTPPKDLPIEEVRSFLIARYSNRNTIDPKVIEDVVGDVFGGLGYIPMVTGYTRDNGIDIYAIPIHCGTDDIVGIQVKRYKNKIEAHLIREFVGA